MGRCHSRLEICNQDGPSDLCRGDKNAEPRIVSLCSEDISILDSRPTSYAQTFNATSEEKEAEYWELAAKLRAELEAQAEDFEVQEGPIKELDTTRSTCTYEPLDCHDIDKQAKRFTLLAALVEKEKEKSFCSTAVQTDQAQSEGIFKAPQSEGLFNAPLEWTLHVDKRQRTQESIFRFGFKQHVETHKAQKIDFGIKELTDPRAEELIDIPLLASEAAPEICPEAVCEKDAEAGRSQPETTWQSELESKREAEAEVVTSHAEPLPDQERCTLHQDVAELSNRHTPVKADETHPYLEADSIDIQVQTNPAAESQRDEQSELEVKEQSKLQSCIEETADEGLKPQQMPQQFDAECVAKPVARAPCPEEVAEADTSQPASSDRLPMSPSSSRSPGSAVSFTPRSSKSGSQSHHSTEQKLDGVWVTREGEPIAVVDGGNAWLLGDATGSKTPIHSLGRGVYSIAFDDEEFLGDIEEGEGNLLMIHWSDGETWVRKRASVGKQAAEISEQKQDESEEESDSTSSSSSPSNTTMSSFVLEATNNLVQSCKPAVPMESCPDAHLEDSRVEDW